jgi:hypothetical protein
MDTQLTVLNYNSQSIALSLFRTVCLQFTTLALLHLSLLFFTSPLVLPSNGGRSPSWVAELSPCHSHSDSCLRAHSLELYLKLLPLVTNLLTSPTVLSGALPVTTEINNPRMNTYTHQAN